MKETLYKTHDHDLILSTADKKYILKLQDLPAEEKPREKLMRYGSEVLSSNELLAVVLGVGTKKEDVLEMSNRILKEYGEKTLLKHTNPKRLAEILEIPGIKACQIVACFELGRRFFKEQKGAPRTVRTARQAYEYLHDMRDLPKEHLRGLYLDTHYRIIHDEVISIGSVTANIIHPREVFRPALEHSASAIVLAHNHPSGVSEPSKADIDITRQLVQVSKIIGIDILDHIIITKKNYTSIPVEY